MTHTFESKVSLHSWLLWPTVRRTQQHQSGHAKWCWFVYTVCIVMVSCRELLAHIYNIRTATHTQPQPLHYKEPLLGVPLHVLMLASQVPLTLRSTVQWKSQTNIFSEINHEYFWERWFKRHHLPLFFMGDFELMMKGNITLEIVYETNVELVQTLMHFEFYNLIAAQQTKGQKISKAN